MKRSTSLFRRVARSLLFFVYGLLGASHVAASDGTGNSVNLRVVGSLVPPACSLSLPAGSTVDYGRVPYSSLSASSHTLFAERNLNFSINCDSPARVALLMLDEKSGTIVHDLIRVVRDEPDANFMANGLGAVDGVNIGIFYVRVFTDVARNEPGFLRTLRSDGAQGWTETPVDAPLYAHGGKAVGFSDGQASVPTPLSTVSGRLAIQTIIRPRSELPTSGEINLAGSSTLTLYYQ